jgi:5'(3')-deoxyribonucleotidase
MKKRLRPRVLVDCDGVLADFFTGAQAIILELSGKLVRFEDLKDWDIFNGIPEDIRDECFTRFSEPGFCANLQVLSDAQEGMRRLAEVSDIYIVTSPMHTPQWAYERNEWLLKHFGISDRKVVQANCKYVVGGEVLIDDRAENIHEWAEHHPQSTGVLWAAPHNAHEPIPSNVVRLSQWGDVVELVERIAK